MHALAVARQYMKHSLSCAFGRATGSLVSDRIYFGGPAGVGVAYLIAGISERARRVETHDSVKIQFVVRHFGRRLAGRIRRGCEAAAEAARR